LRETLKNFYQTGQRIILEVLGWKYECRIPGARKVGKIEVSSCTRKERVCWGI